MRQVQGGASVVSGRIMGSTDIVIGDQVVTRTGETGKVVFVEGGLAKVLLDNTLWKSFPIVTLSKVDPDEE